MVKSALLVLLVAAVPAAHPIFGTRQKVNLDSDRALEEVRSVRGMTFNHAQSVTAVWVEDRCRGRVQRLTLTPRDAAPHLARLDVEQIEHMTARPEVFFVLKSGSPRRPGLSKVVRLDGGGRVCALPRVLFEYTTAQPLGARQDTLVDFHVDVGNYAPHLPGDEIFVAEFYGAPRVPPTSSVTLVTALYRYDSPSRRYVRYWLSDAA